MFHVFEKIVYSPAIGSRVVSGLRSFINHVHFFCYCWLFGLPESINYSEKWIKISHCGVYFCFSFSFCQFCLVDFTAILSTYRFRIFYPTDKCKPNILKYIL